MPLTWLRVVCIFPIQSTQRIDAMQPDDFDHPGRLSIIWLVLPINWLFLPITWPVLPIIRLVLPITRLVLPITRLVLPITWLVLPSSVAWPKSVLDSVMLGQLLPLVAGWQLPRSMSRCNWWPQR